MTRARKTLYAVSRGAALVALFVSCLVAAGVSGAAAKASASPVTTAQVSDTASTSSPGYWLAASDGGIYQFNTTDFGSLRGDTLDRPVVGGAATNDGLGYWLVASDGGIFSFGDARFAGSTGGLALDAPIVGMAADPSSNGYWMVGSDGGVFSYGGAHFYGSTGGIALDKPIVAIVATSTGHGYWLVASDGGVFSFGDARFHGSTGGIALNKPVVGMAATPDDGGYWLVASDGGIFTFGDARFYGSTGGITLDAPVVAMAATPDGGGYWLVGSDGGVFDYGDAPDLGATGRGPEPIVAVLGTSHGYPFPPESTGYDISNYQCPGASSVGIPTTYPDIRIVQVSDGALNSSRPNPCYSQEAAWGGSNLSAYIFMNPLPSPAPTEAFNGPEGSCTGSVNCQSYTFGYYWARHWVAYSESVGVNPNLWWLDVETNGGWATDTGAEVSNGQVIAGAVAGLRSMGKLPGIYSTNYQWGLITGDSVNFPNIALWVPGAENVATGSYSALDVCDETAGSDYVPFADGTIVLVQYGYGIGYSGVDQDYACPAR